MGKVDFGRKMRKWALDAEFQTPLKQLYIWGPMVKLPTCGLDINLLNIRMSLLGHSPHWVLTVKKKGEFYLLCSLPHSQHFAGAEHGSSSINMYRTVEGVNVSQHT